MRKHSFTLIEMLIVVVIIGILAAALIPRLQSVQARARDTKRKADLHQIGTALAIYKEDNGGYTSLTTDRGGWCGSSARMLAPSSIEDSYLTPQGRDADVHVKATIGKYMTSVPTDSDTSSWTANDCGAMYGYVIALLPRHGTSYDSIVLGARTESDGNSSNRVLGPSAQDCTITGDNTNWGGAIVGYNAGGTPYAKAQVYDNYICNVVTFSGSTTNDGSGTCTADKNSSNLGGDIRYIYVQ